MDDTTWDRIGTGVGALVAALLTGTLFKKVRKAANVDATERIPQLEMRIAQLERDRIRLDGERQHMETTIQAIQGHQESTKRIVDRLKLAHEDKIDELKDQMQEQTTLLQELMRTVKRLAGPDLHRPSRMT